MNTHIKTVFDPDTSQIDKSVLDRWGHDRGNRGANGLVALAQYENPTDFSAFSSIKKYEVHLCIALENNILIAAVSFSVTLRDNEYARLKNKEYAEINGIGGAGRGGGRAAMYVVQNYCNQRYLPLFVFGLYQAVPFYKKVGFESLENTGSGIHMIYDKMGICR